MDIESARNDVKQEQLQVEETEDSCVLEYFEIVPLARDTDHNYARVCVSEDLSDEVKQENLSPWAIVWCWLCYPTFSRFSGTPTCDRHRQTDTGPWLVPRMHSIAR